MRDKIIETILSNKKEFISGEEISKSLGISRAAVWKHIKVLKEQGYNIESVNKKGYRLAEEPLDLLTYKNISYKLKTKFIGSEIIHFDSIESTNDYIKKISHTVKEGAVVISEEQTQGRGRLGRKWHSNHGEGIWMSVLLKPNITPYKAPFITLIAGASIVSALNKLGVQAYIKWPNDIIINNKKISGILTELSAEIERINYIVVGIGMNVKTMSFSQEINEMATSLCKEEYNISRVDIVRTILEEFEEMYIEYIESDRKDKTLRICKEFSAIIDKDIYILKDDYKELVRCIDINEEGNLVVRDSGGNIKEIMSGEVSIRGVKGYV